MCRFVDEYHMDGRYQACSCGKHLWSTVSRRMLVHKAGRERQYLTAADGVGRVLWEPDALKAGADADADGDDDECDGPGSAEPETSLERAPPSARRPIRMRRAVATIFLQLFVLAFACYAFKAFDVGGRLQVFARFDGGRGEDVGGGDKSLLETLCGCAVASVAKMLRGG